MSQFVENYSEIKANSTTNMRSLLRATVLNALAWKEQIGGINHWLSKPRVQFLYIHHSFKDELENLNQLMKMLSKQHTFISYSEAVERVLENTIDKPYISISTDDGFKNNLPAAEVLNRYNAKACFFINPGLINVTDYNKIATHCKEKLHLPPIEFLNWDEVSQLQAQGHEIGAHTMFHDNMAKLTTEQLIDDLQACFRKINEHCGEVKHFAYPYGRFYHFNANARKAVFEIGFISCASAERGCHTVHFGDLKKEDLCIRRDHVILDWKQNHIFYFLANNVRKMNANTNLFPY